MVDIRRYLRLLFLWCCFLISAFSAGVLGGKESLHTLGLDLNSNIEKVQGLGSNDCASYVKYAKAMFGISYPGGPENIVDLSNEWKIGYAKFWPPGMPVIIGLLFKAFGTKNYVLHLLIFSSFLWAFSLLGLYVTLDRIKNPLVRFFLTNSIWLFPSFRTWCIGLSIYSEAFASPLFVGSFVIFLISLRKKESTAKRRLLFLSGALLGVAAYFRAIFSYYGLFIGGSMLLSSIVSFSWRTLKALIKTGARCNITTLRQVFKASFHQDLKHRILNSLMYFCAFLLFVVPWEIRNSYVLHSFRMTLDNETHNSWLLQKDNSFLITGNAACISDPDLCQVLNKYRGEIDPKTWKRLALFTLLNHPIRWYSLKARHFREFWIGTPYWPEDLSTTIQYLEGIIILLIAFWSITQTLIFFSKGITRDLFQSPVYISTQKANLALFYSGLIGFCFVNFMIFSFAHYEFRYSLPIRLFFWLFPFVYFSVKEHSHCCPARGAA